LLVEHALDHALDFGLAAELKLAECHAVVPAGVRNSSCAGGRSRAPPRSGRGVLDQALVLARERMAGTDLQRLSDLRFHFVDQADVVENTPSRTRASSRLGRSARAGTRSASAAAWSKPRCGLQ
jgi:hypothetical protein